MKLLIRLFCISIVFVLIATIATFYVFRKVPFSYVLVDEDKCLLASKIAKDGQWRFPMQTMPDSTYIQCLLEFEDKRFFNHLGVDIIAILRAIQINLKAKKIVSGASTVTMQLARMAMHHQKRTISNKLLEMSLAIGLEFRFSKNQILRLYSLYAAYGGNIVGLSTAKWKYYSNYNLKLNFAEAAMLAVLPHQPALIHTKKNHKLLVNKRNKLLRRLVAKNIISSENYELAILEPLPEIQHSHDISSIHVLDYLISKYPNKYYFESTIKRKVQAKALELLQQTHSQLKQNLISNGSVLIIDNERMKVIAYLGNVSDEKRENDFYVDMIHAPRSSGSVLKPLLAAALMSRGLISDNSIVADVPLRVNGFVPENFDRSFSGFVFLRNVLKYSLNVPSVILLQQYGVETFYNDLKKLGFSTLFRNADDYGLPLILGGAEVSSWDLAKVYSNLVNINQTNFSITEEKKIYSINNISLLKDSIHPELQYRLPYSLSSIGKMFSLLRNPFQESTMTQKTEGTNEYVAWKTGTSFGFKDAWCVTMTPKYTVVVWIGNSSGLARPGLIGLHTAAPLAHDIMRFLDTGLNEWKQTFNLMKPVALCGASGFLAGENCEVIDTSLQCESTKFLDRCKFHQKIYLDSSNNARVNLECEANPKSKNYFVVPAIWEFFYKKRNPNFESVPPYRFDCQSESYETMDAVDIIYPSKGLKIWITKDIDGSINKLIFHATCKSKLGTLYWFIDDHYIGSTNLVHEFIVNPDKGIHNLHVTDEFGNAKTVSFEISEKSI